MSTDLAMLVWSAVLCVVLFLPYVLARIMLWGLPETVGYPKNPPPLPDWAQRAERAHRNMAENIGPFAALVLVAHVTGAANEATAMGATIFFWARIAHAAIFIAGIPWVRTLAFVVSLAGEAIILIEILGR